MKIKRFPFMKSLFAKTLVLHPRALPYYFSAARDSHTQTEIKAVFLFHESRSQRARLCSLTTNTALPSDLGNTVSVSAQYKMHPEARSGVDPAPAMDGQHLLQARSKGVTHHLGGTACPTAPSYYLLPKTLATTLEKSETIISRDKNLFPH